MAYDNTNSGALFKNDRKETERHPDYKGSVNVDGVEYWVNSWLNESKSGTKFLSLKLTPKQEQSVQQPVAAHAAADEDVPF